MPRIADYVLNCVIYLYPSVEDAKQSVNVGGSGFIVGVESKTKPGMYFPYAVTNAHVVNHGGVVIRINKRDSTFGFITRDDAKWIRHPDGDDVAITSLGGLTNGLDPTKHQVDFFITEKMFAGKEKIQELDVGIGDETFIVGRLQYADGKIRNTPTVRFGNIAQMPIEPHLMENGLKQEAYLVECHSISGFSGSPVFVYIDEMVPRPKSPSITTQSHTLLLGIDVGHKRIAETVERIDEEGKRWKKDSTLRVLSNSAMMTVIPVWKLKELLYSPELIEIRAKKDEEWSK